MKRFNTYTIVEVVIGDEGGDNEDRDIFAK